MKIVTKVEDLEAAKREWYDRLADFLLGLVDWREVSVLLEAECGKGQLTVPLVRRLDGKCKVIAYDMSAGPYEGDLRVLKKKADAERLENVVETVKGDVRSMRAIANESVDLIISNELFGELDRDGLEQGLGEFYRVLRKRGQMVLAELSPAAQNKAQELLIEANLHYSLETILPGDAYWFSPTVDDTAVLMHKAGFRNIQACFFETNLRLVYEVAGEQLKQWKINRRFMNENKENLRDHGIEFPLEHVVVCKKP